MRAFTSFVLAMPRDTVFWRLVEREPTRVEGAAARDVLRDL
ncbi:hypothetical protein [Nocardiopsis synnemataformans]